MAKARVERSQTTASAEPWEISIVVSTTGTVPHLIATSELDTAAEPHALCGPTKG